MGGKHARVSSSTQEISLKRHINQEIPSAALTQAPPKTPTKYIYMTLSFSHGDHLYHSDHEHVAHHFARTSRRCSHSDATKASSPSPATPSYTSPQETSFTLNEKTQASSRAQAHCSCILVERHAHVAAAAPRTVFHSSAHSKSCSLPISALDPVYVGCTHPLGWSSSHARSTQCNCKHTSTHTTWSIRARYQSVLSIG